MNDQSTDWEQGMNLRKRCAVVVVSAAMMVAASIGTAQQISTFVSAPDGTQLATDVYLPVGSSPWPVVLVRTPYGKDGHLTDCIAFSLSGYACVVQDTRGRFASEGTDTVFRDDPADGRATLDWIANQWWCNGSIGTYGGSAEGITQYAMAPGANSALRCQLVAVATPSPRDHAFLQGGVLRSALVENWLEGQGSLDFLDELKAHRLADDWWLEMDFLADPSTIDTAVLHFGGWYDIFEQGTLDAFHVYENEGGEGARGRQFLFMGPWTHAGDAGELDYSPDAESELLSLAFPWFDHCLKGVSNEVESWPAVSAFIMGAVGESGAPGNRWVALNNWPPKAPAIPLYLNASGELQRVLPFAEETTLTIDPLNPVPTLGGANLFPWVEVDGREMGAGSFDQRPIEARDDVLVFTTGPLEAPLTVMGRIRAHLWIRPDTPDLDLAIRLTDVYPDGRSMLVVDGIQRARMRCGDDRECFLDEGEPAELVVDLWSTAIVINAGHRIRIDISGTNSPRFEVNPNDGSDLNDPDALIVARPALLFGAETPSRLELPILPAPRQPGGGRS
jgi:predicted acyl esterase